MDDTLTLTLKAPIKNADAEISELNLSEPTISQIEEATKLSGIAANIKLLSLNAGITERAVRQMRSSDFDRAIKYLQGFTSAGPEDGSGS
jgi:hypothetical protein